MTEGAATGGGGTGLTTGSEEAYILGVRDGDRRMLAKAITLIESTRPGHQETARRALAALAPETGGAIRLGVTGVPGVGKSTFIEAFGMMLLERGHKVAVLAIDPSSVRSGGSVMADKTRMERLSAEAGAFIRPSPSGANLGGVARKTRESMMLCEAAGYDVVIVETVGVGQSETAVASMTDFFLVLMLAGAGDEVQGLKKGVLELADAIAITKADGANARRAEAARMQCEGALRLVSRSHPVWRPPALVCSAMKMAGISAVWEVILEHRRILTERGELAEKRRRQALAWMWTLVEEGLRERFRSHPEVRRILQRVSHEVERGERTPAEGAERLLAALYNRFGNGRIAGGANCAAGRIGNGTIDSTPNHGIDERKRENGYRCG